VKADFKPGDGVKMGDQTATAGEAALRASAWDGKLWKKTPVFPITNDCQRITLSRFIIQ
jgi:hypothetical protein